MSLSDLRLTKPQARRLRRYFGQGSRACSYEPDGVDLDLIGFKFIETVPTGYGPGCRVTLTQAGLEVLHQLRQADVATRSIHHDLGGRLAEHLRKQGRITWENIEFRNWVPAKRTQNSQELGDLPHWQCVRPDVFSILPSLQLKYANPCVHEVKISRADFLGDLARPEKRQAYAAMAEAVYYVAPEGIIDPKEIPTGFGLMVEINEGEFELRKRPRKRKVDLQPQHYLNMIVKPGVYPAGHQL